MQYDHKLNVNELVAKAGIPEADTYDYTANDPYGIVEQYFQFCQMNLSEESDYEIQPARIYVRDNPMINAGAKKCNDYYVIRVNFGTITTTYRLFTENHKIFQSEPLSVFRDLDKELLSINTPIEQLMYQICCQFTFYHEKAHLIQASPVKDNWVVEMYSVLDPADEPYSLKHHVYEFDADLYASSYIAFHLIEFWKTQNDKIKTWENLHLISSIGVASILSYFIFLMRKYSDMYYKASTHPHPLVRISYIVDNVVKTIKKNLEELGPLDATLIIRNAFLITDALFSNQGKPWVKNLAALFFREKENIEVYVNEVLIAEANALPELTINRIKTSN